MTTDLLLPLIGFCFSTVITPGPNNLMLMASGANFGLHRSLPHMAGVGLGFPAMVVMVGLGAMQIFDLIPGSYQVLQIGSVAYLVWLAWKIATAIPATQAKSEGRPLTFLQAAAFQWINPKAWSMALSAIMLFAASRDMSGVLRVGLVYVLVSVISTSTWVLLGQFTARILERPDHLRLLNRVMAVLLLATLWPVLFGQ